jgi:hypothetical protein
VDYNSVDTKASLWVELHREEITGLLTKRYKEDYKPEEKYLLNRASSCNFVKSVLFITFFACLLKFNLTISIYCSALVWSFLWLLCKEVVKLCVNNFFRSNAYYEVIESFILLKKIDALKSALPENYEEVEYFYCRCLNKSRNENFKYKT